MSYKNKLMVYGFILFFLCLGVYPFLWTLSTSLKQPNEPFINQSLIPQRPTFTNYAQTWTEVGLGQYFTNSLKITAFSIITHLLLVSLAAYAFARYKFAGKQALFFFFMISLMVPGFVSLIPLYLLIKNLHIINTHWALYLPYSGMGMAVSIYLIRTFLERVPLEVEEAARLDGATDLQIFWKIMLPLSRPALVTVVILRSLQVWGEFMWAFLVIQDDNLKTLPIALWDFTSKYPENWEIVSSAIIISILPILLAFAFFQRQFIQGFVEGAVKA